MGARAGKHKLGARTGKYKFGARAGKYKLGARAGKYKLGARGQAKGRAAGNTNTLNKAKIFKDLFKIFINSFKVLLS